MNTTTLDTNATVNGYTTAAEALDLPALELPTLAPLTPSMTATEAHARAVDLLAAGDDPIKDSALKRYATEAALRQAVHLDAAWNEAHTRRRLDAIAAHGEAHLPDLLERFNVAAQALEDAAANPGALATTDPGTFTVLDRSDAATLARQIAPHLGFVQLAHAHAPALLDGLSKTVRTIMNPMQHTQWATVRPVAEHVDTLSPRGEVPTVTGNAAWDAALCPGVVFDLATSPDDLAAREAEFQAARTRQHMRDTIAEEERRYGTRAARQEEGQAMLRAMATQAGA
ncbi:hypothetical protein HMPREF0569_1179 [Micrococcus luteus SK58]|uniref:hypothetical protein n=1 Tax=Micrococcus luteus TaxID=1270 RepID=UPI0001C5015C|nr:hypothetical protein [Micrococcus luteus]EFD51949.1 hypothetical protein HMPREF0569_1179 [Micrococcus luteus SK58]